MDASVRRLRFRARLIALLGLVVVAACGDGLITYQPAERVAVHRIEREPLARTSADPAAAALDYLAARADELGLAGDDVHVVRAARRGTGGQTHIRLRQQHGGVEVLGSELIVHATDAAVVGVNGTVTLGLAGFDATPTLDAARAEALARADYRAAHGLDATLALSFERPAARPVIVALDDQAPVLAWSVEVSTPAQAGAPVGRWLTLIGDASGTVLARRNGLRTIEQASGVGGNAGAPRTWSAALDVEPTGDGRYAMETTRLQTVDMHNLEDFLPDPEDPEGWLWNLGDVVVGPLDGIGDAALNDAHGHTELALDMMRDWMGHDSIDDQGMPIRSRVHYGADFENAFWDGLEMTYGDGASFFYPLSTDIEVVAHEIAHGFTEHHSELAFGWFGYTETDALNEHFSDVAGTVAEFYAEGAAAGLEGLGDGVTRSGQPLRYLCDPRADGASIDHLADFTSETDPHHASGIGNKAFCRAARRLSSGDPDGAVSLEGVRRAGQAWFAANADYWPTDATYGAACQGILDAAAALGYDGDERAAIEASWADVGVACAPIDRTSGCDEILTAPTGVIHSEGWPGPYAPGFVKTWCIQQDPRWPATLEFTHFDLGFDPDDPDSQSPDAVRTEDAMGRWDWAVGTWPPAPMTSSLIQVTFMPNWGGNGFEARWTTPPSPARPPLVEIVWPRAPAILSGVVDVEVAASSSDASEPVVVVELPDGTSRTLYASPYVLQWDSTAIERGRGAIVATATNAAGVSTVVSTGELRILNLRPYLCGDGLCEPAGGESPATCAADCAGCGDGVCSDPTEDRTICPADCAICGDRICDAAYGEDAATCASDCGRAPGCDRNGVCEPWDGETRLSCRYDCGL